MSLPKDAPIAVDLFCGVGGMSLGFENAGFHVAAAFDSDRLNVETYNKNFKNAHAYECDLSICSGQDLRQLAKLGDQQIDVLFGGPPCQGFSMIGKRRADDPRSDLLLHFARLTLELKPLYFVVENVKGLLQGDAKAFVRQFMKIIGAEYCIVEPISILNASEAGVPQQRERVFILGYRKGLPSPKPLNLGESPVKSVSVWDAIGDLPNVDELDYLLNSDIYKGELSEPISKYMRSLRQNHDYSTLGLTGCARTLHTEEVIKRFADTKPGTVEKISRFYRLTKSGFANTLRAGSTSERGSFMAARPIHPVYPRCITVREAARLHSFPDSFVFHDTKWHGFMQIGNSVPPLLANLVAKNILNVIR